MFIATIALSVLLAAAFLGSGAAKLAGAKQSIAIRDRLGVAAGLWRAVGVLEVAAAGGLAAGLADPVLGIAAAVGLVLLLIGAIGTHARSHDLSNAAPGRWTPPTGHRRSDHAARLKLKAGSDMDELTHLIDGERVANDQWFHTVNPTTQQPWAKVARGSTQDAARAVSAARVAFDEGPWPRMTPDERGAHLHRLADLIEQHTDELVALESTDMGKPVTQCRERDFPRSVANFRFFADYPRFCEDESLPSNSHHIYTSYEPVGVTAAISPWNFPLMLSTWKVAPALAFGNTVVLKPAEQSPGTCTRLGELAIEAGLPRGVLNILAKTALVGENGAGKSTLLKCLAGELELDAGKVIRSRTCASARAAGIPPAWPISPCARCCSASLATVGAGDEDWRIDVMLDEIGIEPEMADRALRRALGRLAAADADRGGGAARGARHPGAGRADQPPRPRQHRHARALADR